MKNTSTNVDEQTTAANYPQVATPTKVNSMERGEDVAQEDHVRVGYVSRRLAAWEKKLPNDLSEFGSIAALPLPLQVAFRRKMLSILALHLLFVGCLAFVMTKVDTLDTFVQNLGWIGSPIAGVDFLASGATSCP